MAISRKVRTRSYPAVNMVTDQAAQQSLRLLWERIADLEDLNTSLRAEIDSQAATQAAFDARIATLALRQEEDSISAGGTTTPEGVPVIPGGGTGGGGTIPGGQPGYDFGQFASGIVNPPESNTGHLPAGFPPDAYSAGSIVGGVGLEFPSLLAAAVDQPTRDTNVQEFLGRVLWHLQIQGYDAARQNNSTSGVRLSADKIAVQVGGVWTAYDIFSLIDFDLPLSLHGLQIWPARPYPQGGLPD